MLTQEEKKAILELIARVTGGVKDLGFLLLLASAARKIEATPALGAGASVPAEEEKSSPA